MSAPRFYLGVDLGQATDPTAIVAVEQTATSPVTRYDVRHIERMKLDTSYPDVVKRVRGMLASPELAKRAAQQDEGWRVATLGVRVPPVQWSRGNGGPALVVDATGVGRPVVDMMRAEKLDPIAITITGGDAVTYDRGWRVPKRDLASTVQVLLQSDRLRIASSLPLAAALTQELLAFRVKISALTGHDSYGAGTEWRDGGAHDDLVLALAVALWYAEREGNRKPMNVPSTTSQFVMP